MDDPQIDPVQIIACWLPATLKQNVSSFKILDLQLGKTKYARGVI
jgi:hypothetical protein